MPKHQVTSKKPLPPSILWLIRVLSVLAVTVLSLVICYYVGERFFFDKLFYKKSVFHGYYSRRYYDSNQLNWVFQKIIQHREKDLNDLVNGKIWTKTPGTLTIAVIGDSYTYGVGVTSSERFSALLAPALKKRGITANVYTFAEPGNSVMDYLALYPKVLSQLKPDIVIVGIVSNDLFFNFNRYPGDAEHMAAFDRVCPQPLYINTNDLTMDNEAFFKAAASTFDPQWRNRCYLNEVAKIFGHNPNLIYFNFSAKMSNMACHEQDKSEETLLMNTYIGALESQGVTGLSHLTQDLSQFNFVSQIESHPSRKAHQEFAAELSWYIEKNLKKFDLK